MSDAIVNVNDTTFEADVLQSSIPVLVDFWAEWCGPCRMLAPTLEEIAKEFSGKLIVAKVNVDLSKETPAKYGIRGIPTIILFKNGKQHATKVGLLSKTQLQEFLNENI